VSPALHNIGWEKTSAAICTVCRDSTRVDPHPKHLVGRSIIWLAGLEKWDVRKSRIGVVNFNFDVIRLDETSRIKKTRIALPDSLNRVVAVNSCHP
jgi:hypothetical protein